MIDKTISRRLTFLERLQISRCLGGTLLPCGCAIGRYLTYAGEVVLIIDESAERCRDEAHQVDCVVSDADLRATA